MLDCRKEDRTIIIRWGTTFLLKNLILNKAVGDRKLKSNKLKQRYSYNCGEIGESECPKLFNSILSLDGFKLSRKKMRRCFSGLHHCWNYVQDQRLRGQYGSGAKN